MNRLAMVFAAVIFAFTAGTAAADDDAALKKTMHDYVLTMDKIKAMQGMYDEFNRLKTDPAFAAAVRLGGMRSASLPTAQARLAAIPQLNALYAKHGLTATDVAILPAVMISAGMLAQFPSLAPKFAAQTSPAQIAFYKQHQAEFKNFRWLNGG
jgi:hypothetical protein